MSHDDDDAGLARQVAAALEADLDDLELPSGLLDEVLAMLAFIDVWQDATSTLGCNCAMLQAERCSRWTLRSELPCACLCHGVLDPN